MKQILCLVIVMASGFSGAGLQAAQLSDACQSFVKSLPAGYQWGFVQTPLDYNRPDGAKVDVFYYWNASAAGTPIAFINGGPIVDSHSSFLHLKQVGRTSGPMLFFDQRGTGCSTAAPEVDFVVSQWGSDAIVRDAEMIRAKVYGPTRRWKVLGHSYGAMIAFRYLTLFPQSLVSVHTYGNAVMKDGVEFMKAKMDGQSRIFTKSYAKLYPDDIGLVRTLFAEVNAANCTRPAGEGLSVCGAARLSGLSGLLLTFRDWDTVHMWIGSMASQNSPDGKPSPVHVDEEALSNFISENIFWDLTSESRLFRALFAYELTPGLSDEDACRQALAQTPRLDDLINECRFWTTVIGDLQPTEPPTAAPAPVQVEKMREALVNYPEVALYTYSGEYDYRIPVEVFAEMNGALGATPNYHYQMATGRDHIGYTDEADLWDQLSKESAF